MYVEHELKAIIKKYVRVSKLKPPTNQQCKDLIKLHGEPKIIETLNAMENHKPLLKNYVNAYLTLRNWLNRDLVKATEKATPTGRMIKDGTPDVIQGKELEENRAKIEKGWLTNG